MPYKIAHFLACVTNCCSSTNVCNRQQMRFCLFVFFLIFWDCVLLKKKVYETRKKNECNSSKGKRSRKGAKCYINQLFDIFSFIYKGRSYPLTWQLTVNFLIPDSALLPSKWNAHISFLNYWVALFVNSNYKASIYVPIYVHKGHYKNSISCYPIQMFVRTIFMQVVLSQRKT